MTTTNSSPQDNNNNGNNGHQFVGKVKLKAVKDNMEMTAMDTTEAFIRGALGLGTILRHPVKTFFMFSGGAITLLFVVSVVWGGIYIVFYRPGSVQFAWTNPTTWIPAASDPLRRPIGNAISAFGNRMGDGGTQDGAGQYDPESFDE